MTRTLAGLGLVLALLVGSGQSSALAGVALIQTTAPLADGTEASVKAAIAAAVSKAVRGAAAMGFAWFELRDAQLSGDEVAVQILASDEDPGQEDEIGPGEGPEVTDDDAFTREPGPERPIAERLHI